MASLIEGFENDIFISYRQNDNRYDGWVTDFVANLKKELKATFKEEVNVYFDENPHDGLLEMHHVDDSLRNKIKSLIFIPIISQTYCDPKSYAWRNEFLPFKNLVSEDQFGLNIKLLNSGNVTSRIVPVRIHDLDPEDKQLLESTTGGPLRTINFIFKTPGVNRPLRAHEDHPNDNLDKTYYRDQINKVANLTKEIILSLKAANKIPKIPISKEEESKEATPVLSKRKQVIMALIIFTGLVVSAYYFFKDNSDIKSSPTDTKVAIAVLPFKAIGKEDESQYFADGVMEVILANLTSFPELMVKPGASVEKYRDSKESVADIAEELNVQYVLSGSAQKLGDDIRIVVQLIDGRNDVNVWSETFIKKFNNVFDIQNQISATVAKSLKAKLTTEIRNKINRRPTSDFEAYDLFLRANQWSNKYANTRNRSDLDVAISLLKQSLKKDDHFALGYAWLAGLKAIAESDDLTRAKDSILLLANKAVALDSTVVEAYFVLSQVHHYLLDNVQALRFTYKALEELKTSSADKIRRLGSNDSTSLIIRLASIYSRIGEVDKALYLYDELLKVASNEDDVLRLKFVPLAASGNSEELIKLADRIKDSDHDTIFSNLIMTHVWMERKDDQSIINRYVNWNTLKTDDVNLLDQYILMVAYTLRKNGHPKEAADLVTKFEKQLAPDDRFLQAQLLLYKGKQDMGLPLLDDVQIGWYTLSTCNINPLFENVSTDARYKSFIKRNTDRITDERIRINQLESNSYLPVPRDFFAVQ